VWRPSLVRAGLLGGVSEIVLGRLCRAARARRFMGHENASTTLDRYTHASRDHNDRLRDVFADFLLLLPVMAGREVRKTLGGGVLTCGFVGRGGRIEPAASSSRSRISGSSLRGAGAELVPIRPPPSGILRGGCHSFRHPATSRALRVQRTTERGSFLVSGPVVVPVVDPANHDLPGLGHAEGTVEVVGRQAVGLARTLRRRA
jgi:hypothetical protein